MARNNNNLTANAAGTTTGSYAVGQSSLGIFTRTTASGKGVIGDYTKTETASDTYAMSESGSGTKNFTLSQTGTNSYADIEIGNTSTGVYTRTKIGIDSYSMQEDGSKAGDPYSELVTGIDNYTLIDNGNLGTGKYTRTIDGTGNYDRTVTGLGATLPTDSGTISYQWTQTGDPRSGTFNLTQTGADRYDLLEDFHDVSNTQAGQTPGHMNIYPFGQPFVDPPGRTWGQWIEIVVVAPVTSVNESAMSIAQGGWGAAQAAAGAVTGNSHWGQDNMAAACARGPIGQTEGQPVAQGIVVGSLGVASGAMIVVVAVAAAPAGGGAGAAGGQAALRATLRQMGRTEALRQRTLLREAIRINSRAQDRAVAATLLETALSEIFLERPASRSVET